MPRLFRPSLGLLFAVIVLLALLCILRTADAAPPSPDSVPQPPVIIPGRAVVTLADANCQSTADDLLSRTHGIKVMERVYAYDTDTATVQAVLGPCILRIEPDYEVSIRDAAAPASPNDPLFSQQWHYAKIQLEQAWTRSTGAGVVVAVLDTGMAFNHEDLQGITTGRGRDFINNDNDATDDNGHGSHTTGEVAAVRNNSLGGTGVCPDCKILPVKVLSGSGSGAMTTVAAAIDWASQQPNVKVITMSLGCQACPSTYMQEAINAAYARGVIVIAAAGNANTSERAYPAAHDHVISVAATDQTDHRASFSNYGDWVSLSAPGVNILSTTMDGRYAAMQGTSMAAPSVAGVAALIWAAFPSSTVDQVAARLKNGDNAQSILIGKRINAFTALSGVAGPTLTPGPTLPGPTATTPAQQTYGRQAFNLINNERTSRGLAALIWDDRIEKASSLHNQAMAACAGDNYNVNCLSHQLPGEADPTTRVRAQDFPAQFVLEDIGLGYETPARIVAGWMASQGHRNAILDTRMQYGAVAYLDANGGSYTGLWWTFDPAKSTELVSTLTPFPVHTATPRPPTATVQPPTATPTPGGTPTLDPAYTMSIHFQYRLFSWTEIHNLYLQFCLGMQSRGVWCTWSRDDLP